MPYSKSVLRVVSIVSSELTWQIKLTSKRMIMLGTDKVVEIAIRELRLFARKEAPNEIPGSRNVCAPQS
jgi:hypothetical protein